MVVVERQTGREADRQTGRQTGRQRDRKTATQLLDLRSHQPRSVTSARRDRQAGREGGRHSGRQRHEDSSWILKFQLHIRSPQDEETDRQTGAWGQFLDFKVSSTTQAGRLRTKRQTDRLQSHGILLINQSKSERKTVFFILERKLYSLNFREKNCILYFTENKNKQTNKKTLYSLFQSENFYSLFQREFCFLYFRDNFFFNSLFQRELFF